MAEGSRKRSNLAFAGCAALLVAIKLLFEFYPGEFPVRGQAEAFTWPLIGAILLIGFLGLLAERSLGLPDAFSDPQRDRAGMWIALASGLLYGLVTIGQDSLIPSGGNVLNLKEWAHVPWPWSVPFYTFGAIFLEFLLRLGGLCIFVWFFHVVIFRRRAFMATFWTVNLVIASYEVLPTTLAEVEQGDRKSVV